MSTVNTPHVVKGKTTSKSEQIINLPLVTLTRFCVLILRVTGAQLVDAVVGQVHVSIL